MRDKELRRVLIQAGLVEDGAYHLSLPWQVNYLFKNLADLTRSVRLLEEYLKVKEGYSEATPKEESA
jgi:hypothetical protein